MIKNFFKNFKKANAYDLFLKELESKYESKKEELILKHRQGVSAIILISEVNILAEILGKSLVKVDDVPGTLEFYPKKK